jgi:hypothetical protein
MEEKFLNSKWLNINEEIAQKEIINCAKIAGMKIPGKFVVKNTFKWKT